MSPIDPEVYASRLGLTRESLAKRTSALGLTAVDRELLIRVYPALSKDLTGFIDSLYQHLGTIPEMARMLGDSDHVQHLKRQQQRYLEQLFLEPIEWSYALSRVKIGVIHFQVGLLPSWFIATYAHFVSYCSQVILEKHSDKSESLPTILALLKTVFLDVTLILDAYGLEKELALRAPARSDSPKKSNSPSLDINRSGDTPRSVTSNPLSKVQVTSSGVLERRAFVGLTEHHLELLSNSFQSHRTKITPMIEGFYEAISRFEEVSSLIPAPRVAQLKKQLESYWSEFFLGLFDRPHAASRMVVGVVHERIGLQPQWYFIGVYLQIELLLKDVLSSASESDEEYDAFIRALFFDLSYVIDAYIDARAETVLRTEGYANQLIAGLTSGILVVDGNQRVLSVNQRLLQLLGVDSRLIYQVPVQQALPMKEVTDVLSRIDPSCSNQRHSTIGKLGNRLVRFTAIQLDAWDGVSGNPVAIVLDDVSDLVEFAVRSEEKDFQLSTIIEATELTIWELNISDWSLEAVSSPVLGLTGFRDVYFIGRKSAWLDCIPSSDRDKFIAYCTTIPANGKQTFEHRMHRVDGREIWVRTIIRRSDRNPETSIFGVTIDITDERQDLQRRNELNLAIARGDEKSKILTTMSHEIRTPLNGVIGMLSMLTATKLEAPIAQYVDTAHKSSLELLALLNDVLDISKLEAGRMTVEASRFDLVSLVESVFELFIAEADRKGIAFGVHLDPRLHSGRIGAAPRVRQILINLVSNAIKFTEHGLIQISVAEAGGEVVFEIADSGIGIPESRREHLFKPFHQLHDIGTGSGLGLAISKQLAELMGGNLTAPPRAEGATFLLALPLKRAELLPLPEGKGRAVRLDISPPLLNDLQERLQMAGWRLAGPQESDATVIFVDNREKLAQLRGTQKAVLCGVTKPELRGENVPDGLWCLGLRPLNERTFVEVLSSVDKPIEIEPRYQGAVLVADDNPVNQKVITVMLERLGFDVDVVLNGSLAVDAAKRKSYSLVFMDMIMPELNGTDATRQIRIESQNKKTPIIALTGNILDEEIAECLSSGMNEVLTKPLLFSSLRKVIENYL